MTVPRPISLDQLSWCFRLSPVHRFARIAINAGNSDPAVSLCIPLKAQNETLGLFSIVMPDSVKDADIEPIQFLVTVIAENTALALANIRLRNRLREESLRDPLTGLYNRRYFMETIHQEIRRADRSAANLSLIAIDIDHFKRCNDTYGHAAGDMVLQEIAAVLTKVFRGGDVTCRQGGEEFVALLPDAPLSVAHERAEEVREAVAALRLNYLGKRLGSISISGGVASYRVHGNSAEDLLKSADLALYEAKSNGRDRIEIARKEVLLSAQGVSFFAPFQS